MENKKSIQIYVGKRAWYELALAAVFYTFLIYTVLMLLFHLTFDFDVLKAVLNFFDFLYYGLPSLASALAFSVTKEIGRAHV